MNLEFTEKPSLKNINTENYSFICRIKDNCKHSLHTDNPHLNALTDLVINLGYNLQKDSIINKQLLEKISVYTEEFKKYSQNLDYIKDQNNQILKELKRSCLEKQTENIHNNNIQIEVDKITDAINKLNIEDIKIIKKPTPYKHWQPRK